KPAEARHDWEILLGLSDRLARRRGGDGWRARLVRRVMGTLGPRGVIGTLLRFGPYGAGVNPLSPGLSLKKLEHEVSGVDLGPLQPCLPERLHTRSKRIDLVPRTFVDDLP